MFKLIALLVLVAVARTQAGAVTSTVCTFTDSACASGDTASCATLLSTMAQTGQGTFPSSCTDNCFTYDTGADAAGGSASVPCTSAGFTYTTISVSSASMQFASMTVVALAAFVAQLF